MEIQTRKVAFTGVCSRKEEVKRCQTTASTACNAPVGTGYRSGVHDHSCSLGETPALMYNKLPEAQVCELLWDDLDACFMHGDHTLKRRAVMKTCTVYLHIFTP
nr:uncharacterized protein LOC127335501 [Lolium perenne]